MMLTDDDLKLVNGHYQGMRVWCIPTKEVVTITKVLGGFMVIDDGKPQERLAPTLVFWVRIESGRHKKYVRGVGFSDLAYFPSFVPFNKGRDPLDITLSFGGG